MGLINNGFSIDALIEAEPSKEMLELPYMKDELRRPMMLLVKATKKQRNQSYNTCMAFSFVIMSRFL